MGVDDVRLLPGDQPLQGKHQFGIRKGRCMAALGIGVKARQTLERAAQAMHADRAVQLGFGRSGMHQGPDADMMAPLRQRCAEIADVPLLSPDHRRIELRQ
jgi:hypothetical protein